MPKTRAAHKRSASARRSYRRRVKSSHCRGKGPAACRGASGCRVASGRKRSFCRKSRNTKRHRGGMGCGKKVGGTRKHRGRGSCSGGKRGHKGKGVLSNAAVPFGLFGLQRMYRK